MKSFLLIFIMLFTLSSFAQNKKIWGYVLDSATRLPIENASITNISKNATSMSNTKGRFSIEVTDNNILSIASINHYFDTLTLTNKLFIKDTLVIYLTAITNNLKEVTVTAILNRYQFDSSERRRKFLAEVGSNKIPTIAPGNSGAGIVINLDRFSKREKSKRRAYNMFESMEQEQYINYRFSKQLVSNYTTLSGDSLLQFMQLQRPSYMWLRQNTTNEDIKYYINEQLKIYFKRKKN